MDLSSVDTGELQGRLREIVIQLDGLVKKLGPLLKELGNFREEAALIDAELRKRKAPNVEPPVS